MAWVVYASKLLQKLIHKNAKEQTRTQGVYGSLQSCVRLKRRSHWQDYKKPYEINAIQPRLWEG